MKKLLVSVLAVAGMVACHNDVVVERQSADAISFDGMFVEHKTRSVDPSITTETIDSFDVWGFMDDAKGVIFDGVRVTKGADGWTYSDLQYWGPEHDYYFYAVAPVDNENITVNKELNIKGLGTIDFVNADGTVDLIYAKQTVSTDENRQPDSDNGKVNLQFAHLLSKVKFTFVNAFPAGHSSLKVENIIISKAPSAGTVTLNADARTWEIIGSDATLNFGHVNEGTVNLNPTEKGDSDFERLTIPADANLRYQVDFDLTLYNGENVAMTSHKTAYLENQAFVMGKNYNVTVTINADNFAEEALEPIEFDVVGVDEWVPGENNGQIDFGNEGESIDPENPETPAEPVALDAPKVVSAVEANVVTLTWDAVEGASKYEVIVDDDVPAEVTDTKYVFEGDYAVEYTFSVKAIAADAEKNLDSEASVVVVTTEAKVEEPQDAVVSVSEFLAAAEGTTLYTLKGVITKVDNTTYGNFYLKDATGEVLIYGLCSPEGEQKYWAASGAKVGDTITVKTVRGSYNGTPQGKNALFVELVPFVAEATEWGVVGDLTNWATGSDIVMYTTWKAEKLYVAYGVEIASGAFKVRANNEWNDAKNYGLAEGGKVYADKYYTLINGASSQNITPMAYGTYDVYFDLANERVALVTPGKEYADAVAGGDPVVVVEGLTDHSWGLIGSFDGNSWSSDVATLTIEGDWAVAKNVTLASGTEFKFRADAAWSLSYGSACDVNVGETYKTYANGGNMKFVGETGAYNLYFSMVDAKFYMEAYVEAPADTKGVYSSEAFLKGSNDTSNSKYYLEKVNIGGTSYDCLKIGTSSVVGKYTTKEVGEFGDKTLSFYAVGWNGKTSKLNVYVDGVKVGSTLTLKANAGAKDNTPYTITPSDDTDYYSIACTGVTESSKITFETVSGATRAIIFGVQLN